MLTADALPAGPGAPTGKVTFKLGSTVLGTAALKVNSAGVDQASVTTTALPAGTDTVTASYPGDATFASSTAMCVISVVKS